LSQWIKIGKYEFHVSDKTMSWEETLAYAESVGGRVPSRWELCKWIDEDGYQFPWKFYVWTSSTMSNNTSSAWLVFPPNGYTFNAVKTNSDRVLCVR